MENKVRIFSGSGSEVLAEKIAKSYGTTVGKKKLTRFSDGEFTVSFEESIRGQDMFIVQSTMPPSENLFELLLMIDAAKRASAGYITAVMPYYGYARQDRKDKARVPISAKLVASLLEAAGADRVMTMDLHADQIQGFFDIPVDHLKSEAIFTPFMEEHDLSKVVFACPDAGGVKRARVYSKIFKKELVICDKLRSKANKVDEIIVIGDVKNKDVILIDDIIDTAGTLCMAADELVKKGAKSVKAFCTHPVLSGNAYEKIKASKLSKLYVTDTMPLKQKSKKIEVLSTAMLFSRAIRNVFEHKSISALFVEGS